MGKFHDIADVVRTITIYVGRMDLTTVAIRRGCLDVTPTTATLPQENDDPATTTHDPRQLAVEHVPSVETVHEHPAKLAEDIRAILKPQFDTSRAKMEQCVIDPHGCIQRSRKLIQHIVVRQNLVNLVRPVSRSWIFAAVWPHPNGHLRCDFSVRCLRR